jgi:hypothetical protein
MAVNPKISPPLEVTDVLKGLRPRQNKTRELDVPVQYILDIIRTKIGEAAWGSITTGTGVASQADLVAYLAANYVPVSRTLTINGVSYDLSSDRSWTVSGGGVSGTPTRIPFFDTASSLADDPLFYWDDINKALIVGASSSPSAAARLYLFSSTNNADVFIESAFNQRLKFKNNTSGVQWHTSTNIFEDTPGNPRDSYNIGQSSNPALGYLEILKSGRVKIGGNIAGTLGFTDTVMLELGLIGVRGGQMILNALTAGSLILKASNTTTPYTFTFPNDAGSSGEVLKTDGSGNTYWDTGGGGGDSISPFLLMGG